MRRFLLPVLLLMPSLPPHGTRRQRRRNSRTGHGRRARLQVDRGGEAGDRHGRVGTCFPAGTIRPASRARSWCSCIHGVRESGSTAAGSIIWPGGAISCCSRASGGEPLPSRRCHDLAEDRSQNALSALADDPNAQPDKARRLSRPFRRCADRPQPRGRRESDGPGPELVFGLMPGGIASNEKERGIPLEDLSSIRPTLIITMSGDRDYLPSDRASRLILQEATAVPASRKLFMRACPTITASRR